MTRRLLTLAAALLLANAGCTLIVSDKLDEKPEDPTDSGTGTTDGGTMDGFVPDTDGGPTVSICEGAADGTLCTVTGVSGMFVCVDELCSVSTCGDGVVDSRLGEQCDDMNDVSGDGCEPFTCAFTCSDDTECDDERTCNGTEACNVSTHVCEPGDPADDGTGCARDDGTDGVCRAGSCVGAGCGNGAPDSGEECDDGNLEDGDGCDSDCTWTCETDEECIDGDVCNGEESCDVDAHTCNEGTPMECNDDDSCTEDNCDPAAGCIFDSAPFDTDEDGHFTESCGGDDCDDTDRTVYEGAEELCDGIDNDCDDSVDETAPYWYVDCDEDTFAPGTAGSMQSCDKPTSPPSSCPVGGGGGWTSTRPASGAVDCNDNARTVTPTQSGWFTAADPVARFDYNCDGDETHRYGYDDGSRKSCGPSADGSTCSGTPYYNVRTEPSCGDRLQVMLCLRFPLTGACGFGPQDTVVSCH